MSTTTTTTKRTTPAKAKAKADASIAVAAALLAQPLSDADRVTLLAKADSSRTLSEAKANVRFAAGYVAKAEADAFDAIVAGRVAIGVSLYDTYCAALALADSNETPKALADVSLTTIMAKGYSTNRDDYNALDAAKRPAVRGWSTLSEDLRCAVRLADGSHRATYDAWRAAQPDSPALSVRDYLAVAGAAIDAEAAAAAEAGDDAPAQSSQRRSAKAKAEAAKAEAERQIAAKAKRDDDAAKAKADDAAKRANIVTGVLRHVAEHPSANLIPGVSLTCAEAGALSVSTLRALADAATILADAAEAKAKADADAAKAKGTTPIVAPIVADGQQRIADTEAEVAALGAAAEAGAGVPSLADSIATAVAAALAAAGVAG